MPVAAVAGKPRGVEAQHCPDLPGAQRCHQPLEARPRPPSRWQSGRDRHRSLRPRGTLGPERRRRARTGAAGPRGCSGPGSGWTAEHRRPLCASAPRPAGDQRSSSSRSSAATPAASRRSRVNRASAIRRSEALIPRSSLESNGMLSWRGVAGSGGVGSLLILLLPGGARIVPGASSETALDQQLMQLSQRRHGHPRRAKRHSDAGGRIEHPRGHDDDHAGRRFDVDDLAAGAPLRILAANPSPIERVPAVTNFNFLPDMGRMTARLPSAARHGSSPAPSVAATGPPSCTR
jgi:hypothetical protein